MAVMGIAEAPSSERELWRSIEAWRPLAASMDSEVYPFLRQTLGCSAELAATIGARAVAKRFPARAILVKQGDYVSFTFLLVIGRVQAFAYGPEGQAVLMQEFLPGDFSGPSWRSSRNLLRRICLRRKRSVLRYL